MEIDLKNILNAYKNLLYPDTPQEIHDLAEKRLNICNKCEHKEPITHVCKLCLCFTPAKVYGKNSCPEKKWDDL